MRDNEKIRALNDLFRTSLKGGQLVATRAVALRYDLPVLIKAVKTFSNFTEENDPYGEHDFGAFEHDGEKFFWKIDYYDRWREHASPNPCDATVTCRVLTLMLAEEY